MLLALDIGNTNIVLGVFDGKTLAHSWRLTTLRDRTADELGLLMHGLFDVSGVDRKAVRAVIMASVVPPLTNPARAMVERYLGVKAMVVEPGLETGMPILYDPPSDVGADRIVNGIAAYEQYGRAAQCPMVVVDFGTATTLDAITAKGEYLGGAICPGVTISADALFQRAARLPRIDVRKPTTVVGRTTVGAMESGLFWGYVGMVEGLVRRMSAELAGPRDSTICVATGGLAGVIAPETPLIHHVEPDLTLHGLRIVWERNQ
jgi:type III pantothenate kinase